jgi:thiamine-phosphate pyrophosphorylase
MRYAITDGSSNPAAILSAISHWADSRSIDRLQIREKRLTPKTLYELTQAAIAIARPAGIEVLVNERADIALAAGADGVHLPSRAISPATLRKLGIRLIGVSCHNEDELQQAARKGADFAVLAPVFSPLSKTIDSPPLGLEAFRRLVQSTPIPVLALGGVTLENIAACLQAGAAGVAGITFFNASAPRPSTGTAAHPEPRSPRW